MDKICRICLDTDSVQPSGGISDNIQSSANFISPCHCKGSLEFVHKDCLDSWRLSSSSRLEKCTVCMHSYNYKIPVRYIVKSRFRFLYSTYFKPVQIYGYVKHVAHFLLYLIYNILEIVLLLIVLFFLIPRIP